MEMGVLHIGAPSSPKLPRHPVLPCDVLRHPAAREEAEGNQEVEFGRVYGSGNATQEKGIGRYRKDPDNNPGASLETGSWGCARSNR